MTTHIKTDHKYKPLLSWFDLSEKEQSEFDLASDPEFYECETYFRYKKQVYMLSEFMRCDEDSGLGILGFNGTIGTSYFSGIAVKLSDCCDSVIVARLTW